MRTSEKRLNLFVPIGKEYHFEAKQVRVGVELNNIFEDHPLEVKYISHNRIHLGTDTGNEDYSIPFNFFSNEFLNKIYDIISKRS